MNTLKKMWQYQKLLTSSYQFGNTDPVSSPNNNAGCVSLLPVIFSFLLFSYAFSSMNAICIVLISLSLSYGAATSKRKLYALVPVSKKYALFNLYILPIVSSIILYALMYGVMIIIALIMLAAKILPDNRLSSDMAAYPAGIKTALFAVMFVLFAVLITTAISVIQRRKLRLISLIIWIGISSGLMIWLKRVLPSISLTTDTATFSFTLGFENILPGFEQLPYAWIILSCMAAVLIVITPLSIRFAYSEFMLDVSKKID